MLRPLLNGLSLRSPESEARAQTAGRGFRFFSSIFGDCSQVARLSHVSGESFSVFSESSPLLRVCVAAQWRCDVTVLVFPSLWSITARAFSFHLTGFLLFLMLTLDFEPDWVQL